MEEGRPGRRLQREIGGPGCCPAGVNPMTLLDVMYLMGYSREGVKVLLWGEVLWISLFFSRVGSVGWAKVILEENDLYLFPHIQIHIQLCPTKILFSGATGYIRRCFLFFLLLSRLLNVEPDWHF